MRSVFMLLCLLLSVTLHAAEAPPLQIASLGDFKLENGDVIQDAKIAYRTAGTLNADRSNVILFPTWFTGTSEELFTSDAVGAVDTSQFFLITVDALANGISSSPSNSTQQPQRNFPVVSIGDMVQSQHQLLTEVLDITHLHAVIGISMGGMQAYEWVTTYPEFMDRAVPIVGSPRLASYDLLLWTAQLIALEQALDCDCNETTALEVAGMISHLALYSPDFHARQDPHDQGAALLKDGRAGGMTLAINDRVAQLQAMITHDVSTSFDGKWPATAEAVKAEMLAVVGTYDHMVTPGPALTFAELTNSQTLVLDNDCGHQSFRCEQDRAFEEIRAFLSTP